MERKNRDEAVPPTRPSSSHQSGNNDEEMSHAGRRKLPPIPARQVEGSQTPSETRDRSSHRQPTETPSETRKDSPRIRRLPKIPTEVVEGSPQHHSLPQTSSKTREEPAPRKLPPTPSETRKASQPRQLPPIPPEAIEIHRLLPPTPTESAQPSPRGQRKLPPIPPQTMQTSPERRQRPDLLSTAGTYQQIPQFDTPSSGDSSQSAPGPRPEDDSHSSDTTVTPAESYSPSVWSPSESVVSSLDSSTIIPSAIERRLAERRSGQPTPERTRRTQSIPQQEEELEPDFLILPEDKCERRSPSPPPPP